MSQLNATGVLQAQPVRINWHSGLPIFASEPFLKTVGDEYGWLGGGDGSGGIRCILPYTLIRKPFFRLVRFRTQTISLGEELTLEEEKQFLNNVAQHFRSRRSSLILPASNNTLFRTYPDGAVAAPYGSYVVDLTETEEALWDNLHAKHRNVIRSALKAGIQIRVGKEYLETACRLIRDTLQRSAMRFLSPKACERLSSALGDNVKVFVALSNGSVQGCALVPFSQHGAYYLFGGSAVQPATGAMNLLHWEAIKLFRDLGVRRYDFVGVRINPERGSKQEGLSRFKQRFGGQLVQGYMWKHDLHPLKFSLYNLAVRFHRGGDIVDQERDKIADHLAPRLQLGRAADQPGSSDGLHGWGVFHRSDEG